MELIFEKVTKIVQTAESDKFSVTEIVTLILECCPRLNITPMAQLPTGWLCLLQWCPQKTSLLRFLEWRPTYQRAVLDPTTMSASLSC